MNDMTSLQMLKADGYDIKIATARRLRRSLGLRKQYNSSQYEDMEKEIRDIVSRELGHGNVSNYGRRELYAYMRSKYDIVVSRSVRRSFSFDSLLIRSQ